MIALKIFIFSGIYLYGVKFSCKSCDEVMFTSQRLDAFHLDRRRNTVRCNFCQFQVT